MKGLVHDGGSLRAARKARGMTTHVLAKLIGVHRNTVIRWEGGDPIPGPALLSLQWLLSPVTRTIRKDPPHESQMAELKVEPEPR